MLARLLLATFVLAGCHAGRLEPLTQVSAKPAAAKRAPVPRDVDDPPAPRFLRPGRTVVTDTSITILDTIQFIHASAEIDQISIPMLDAVVGTLEGNPSITLFEVQAFGDGDAQLGESRAHAIVDYLVGHGIDPDRLQASGAALPLPGQGRGGTRFLIVKRGD